MAVQTGRTPGKHIKVQIGDTGDVIRDLPVATIAGVGITADLVDLTALQDALTGGLTGQGTVEIPITGPFDTSAAQAASTTTQAPALSGSHTVLSVINNLNTPRSFGVYIGVRHNWEAGEPVFGVTKTAANGVLVKDYTFSDDGTYSALVVVYAGSATLAWGTAQLS